MKLFFRKIGTGPPLVILHGLYGSSDNWVSVAKSISDYFTVYLPDQRNHGQSGRSAVHDYKSMSEDLYETVINEGLKKFFLAGHSMGGKTAIKFAMQWPEMVEGLLIADISPFAPEKKSDEFYMMHKNILETILSINLSTIVSRSEAGVLLSERISSEKIIGFILKNLDRTSGGSFQWKINAEVLLKNLDAIMDGIPRQPVIDEHITGFPVIFLKASESSYIPESDFSDIYKLFPAAQIRIIENSGHWIHADRPDAVKEEFLNLLNN